MLCAADYCVGHSEFGLPGVAGNFFHCLRNLLARAFAVEGKAWQLPQHLQGAANRLNQLAPVDLAYQAQAVDDVADGEVGRHLRRLAASNQRQAIDAMQIDPVHQHRVGIAGLVGYALPQLG